MGGSPLSRRRVRRFRVGRNGDSLKTQRPQTCPGRRGGWDLLSQVQTVCRPPSGSFQEEMLREAAPSPKLRGSRCPPPPLLPPWPETRASSPTRLAPLSPPAPFHARGQYLSLQHLPENPSSRNPPGPSPRHLNYLSNTIASWKLPFPKVTPPFSFLPHLGRFSAGMRMPQRPSHRSGGECSVSFLCCDQPGLGALWITLNIRVYFTRQGLGGREQL